MPVTDDFQQFVDQVQAGLNQFVTGNAALFKEQWSQANDVTVFGGFGGYLRGWEQVDPGLDLASARFRIGHLAFELLALGMSGDLAYSVWLEKGEVRALGREEPNPVELRVTHIYRREDGSWKVTHRHADVTTGKIEATAASQQQGSR